MLGQLGVDDVVQSLEAIIDVFRAEMADIAVDLVSKLVQLFHHYTKSAESNEDDEQEYDSLSAAALNCLDVCVSSCVLQF